MGGFEQKIEQEPLEPIEILIESSLEHGAKFDEGQNAIVLEVDPNDIDESIRTTFFSGDDALMPDEEFVSKALRVFNSGHSEEEAKNQIKAKEILEGQEETAMTKLAKVPEIYTHRDITIHSQKLKDKLSEAGVDVSSGKVGVLLMYRVQGVDFLNYLLREAIKHCPEQEANQRGAVTEAKRQLEIDSKSLSTAEIFKAASVAVGFEQSDKLSLSMTNRDRLLKYLKKHKFILDPEIISKIERTVEALNNNNFYHNDLTERNVMVELDDDGQPIEVYMIDFEKSSNQESEEFGGDMVVIGRYKMLSKSRDQEIEEVRDSTIEGANKLKERIAKVRPEIYDSVRDDLARMLNAKDDNSIRVAETNAFAMAESILSGQAGEFIIAILLEIAEENPDAVREYIIRKRQDKKTSLVYSNLLSRIEQRL
jgi:tRNA A-37 threonylcarbamoyl transferase component Bud32